VSTIILDINIYREDASKVRMNVYMFQSFKMHIDLSINPSPLPVLLYIYGLEHCSQVMLERGHDKYAYLLVRISQKKKIKNKIKNHDFIK
jgi:hypothetical protein